MTDAETKRLIAILTPPEGRALGDLTDEELHDWAADAGARLAEAMRARTPES